mmetsp:Transcript_51675/g.85001  ORF Transcript_51675/g.85001 Transcript_51675/m.85001 type:complete len:210 (+) Transcript_51675:332-961(+)
MFGSKSTDCNTNTGKLPSPSESVTIFTSTVGAREMVTNFSTISCRRYTDDPSSFVSSGSQMDMANPRSSASHAVISSAFGRLSRVATTRAVLPNSTFPKRSERKWGPSLASSTFRRASAASNGVNTSASAAFTCSFSGAIFCRLREPKGLPNAALILSYSTFSSTPAAASFSSSLPTPSIVCNGPFSASLSSSCVSSKETASLQSPLST